jgi:hypothetical protein
MAARRLVDIAKTIRSKNASPDRLTFDIIFRSRADYDLVRNSGALTRETVAALFRIPEEEVTDFVAFDPALAIKFSIVRPRTSGSVGDGDIYGAQQYGPLFDIQIPTP